MRELKQKRYAALIGIMVLVLAIVGIIHFGTIDKYAGKLTVSNVSLNNILTGLNADINAISENDKTLSKGYDEVNYSINYNITSDNDLKRTVIIEASLNDDEKYASFKEINSENITSVLNTNKKKITITVTNVETNVEQSTNVIMIVEGAPNGYKVTPTIKIKESTEDNYKSVSTTEIEVKTNSLSGMIRDENGLSIKNIEVALTKNKEIIKKTYTDENGTYVFSDIEEGTYDVEIDEEVYEKVKQESVNIKETSNLDIYVKSVEPYEIEVNKYINSITINNNGKENTYTYGKIKRVQQSVQNLKEITGSITYIVTVENKGTKSGIVTVVKDPLPEGLSFDKNKNSSWEEKNGIIYNRSLEGITLKAGEKREEKLVLDIVKTNEAKNYINKITANGEVYEKVVYILDGETYKEETVLEGEKINEPEVSSNAFSGWYTDKKYTNRYNFNLEVTKDLILYGKTKDEVKYSVKFYDQGNLWDEQNIKEGDKANKPVDPTKEGYTFKCWQDENYNEWDFNDPILKNTTLTSCYDKNEYTIEFYDKANSNGSKYELVSTITKLYEDVIDSNSDVPTLETWEGHTFEKWTTDDDGNNDYDFTSPITKNLKLYSQYTTQDRIVIFDDENRITEKKIKFNTTVEEIDSQGKEGYTFKHWSLEKNGEAFNFDTLITSTTTLYAVYDINEYTITFLNEGEQYDEQVIEYGNTVTRPTDPTKEGYTFTGWYEDDTLFNFDTPIQKNITLNSKYDKNTYTVRFVVDGNLYKSESVEYLEKVTKPTDPVKENNFFIGWKLDLTDEDLFDFDTQITNNISLYGDFETVEVPTVTHTPTTWTNDSVTVTIKNDNHLDYTFKYKVDDGQYVDYTGPFTIEENCNVITKSIKGDAESVTVVHEIDNIDKIKPTITSVSGINLTETSFDVVIKSKDDESGMKTLKIYKDDILETTINYTEDFNDEKTDTYTFGNLENGTTYKISVVAYDVAGNISDSYDSDITTGDVVVARIIGRQNSLYDDEENYENFSSLENAIKACPSGQCTIQMVLSTNESVQVLEGQNIKLDINNTTITGTKDTYTIENEGNLTIVDDAEDTTGSIVNTNGIAISNVDNGVLTIGENEEQLVVSTTVPYINGGSVGVYSSDSATFNFYDGLIAGTRAIDGSVDDSPVLYSASVTEEESRQGATLQILSDAEARREGIYYTRLSKAVEDVENSEYSYTTENKPLLQSFTTKKGYGFVYNDETQVLENEQTTATNYFESTTTIDLTGFEGTQVLSITGYIENYDSNVSGTLYIPNLYKTYYLNGEEDTYIVYLDPGTVYELKLIFSKGYNSSGYSNIDSTSPKMIISNISVSGVINNKLGADDSTDSQLATIYGFDYNPETKQLISNNQYTKNTKAFSYIEVDLTNEESDYELLINAMLDTYSSYNIANIIVKENDNSINSSSSYSGVIASISGTYNKASVAGPYNFSRTLSSGKKYYIQFYYFKNSNDYINGNSSPTKEDYESIGVKDQFIINSLDLVSISNETTTVDLSKIESATNKGYALDGSYYKPSQTSIPVGDTYDSYIKIDLTDETNDKLISISDYFYSNYYNTKYLYITTNKKDVSYDDIVSNRVKTLMFYDNSGSYSNNNQKYVLEKGNVYYLHFATHSFNTYYGDLLRIDSITMRDVTNEKLKIGSIYSLTGTEFTPEDEKVDSNTSYIYDDTDDKSFRYIGKNPDNYVTFNDETWRIVGIFDTEDKNGNIDKRIKLVRNDYIGAYSWDTSFHGSGPDGAGNLNGGNGINEWSQADLMYLLNPGYEDHTEPTCYNDADDGHIICDNPYLVNNSLYWTSSSGQCFSGGNNAHTNCDFTETGLKDSAKEFIDEVKWYTGSINEPYSSITVYRLYELERGNATGKDGVTKESYAALDDVDRTTYWYGKVGLLYPTDAMLSAGDYSNYSRSNCFSYNISVGNYGACVSQSNWLFNSGMPYHTLNPTNGLAASNSATLSPFLGTGQSGYFYVQPVYSPYNVKPAVYLKTNVNIKSGSGTQDDPYILELISQKNEDATFGIVKPKEPMDYDDDNTITLSSGTDYNKVKEGYTIKGFTYDDATGYFINDNIGEAQSISVNTLKIDLTQEENDVNYFVTMDFKNSNSNNVSYLIFETNEGGSADYTMSKIDYTNRYNISSSCQSPNCSVIFTNAYDYSITNWQYTLTKGNIYYIHMAVAYNEAHSDEDYYKISFNKMRVDTDSTVTDFDQTQVSLLNSNQERIDLLKNITLSESLTIDSNKDIVLDLNGNSLSNVSGDSVITNNGELTIVDSVIHNVINKYDTKKAELEEQYNTEYESVINNGYTTEGLVLELDASNYTPGDTTWTDLTGNGHNATMTGAETLNEKNNALYFGGNPRSIPAVDSEETTYEIVFEQTSESSSVTLFSTPIFYCSTNSYFSTYLASGSGNASKYITNKYLNKIYDIVATKDSEKTNIYIDGELSYSFDTSTSSNISIDIGYRFYGNIYTIKQYDRVLTQDEITKNANYNNYKYNGKRTISGDIGSYTVGAGDSYISFSKPYYLDSSYHIIKGDFSKTSSSSTTLYVGLSKNKTVSSIADFDTYVSSTAYSNSTTTSFELKPSTPGKYYLTALGTNVSLKNVIIEYEYPEFNTGISSSVSDIISNNGMLNISQGNLFINAENKSGVANRGYVTLGREAKIYSDKAGTYGIYNYSGDILDGAGTIDTKEWGIYNCSDYESYISGYTLNTSGVKNTVENKIVINDFTIDGEKIIGNTLNSSFIVNNSKINTSATINYARGNLEINNSTIYGPTTLPIIASTTRLDLNNSKILGEVKTSDIISINNNSNLEKLTVLKGTVDISDSTIDTFYSDSGTYTATIKDSTIVDVTTGVDAQINIDNSAFTTFTNGVYESNKSKNSNNVVIASSEIGSLKNLGNIEISDSTIKNIENYGDDSSIRSNLTIDSCTIGDSTATSGYSINNTYADLTILGSTSISGYSGITSTGTVTLGTKENVDDNKIRVNVKNAVMSGSGYNYYDGIMTSQSSALLYASINDLPTNYDINIENESNLTTLSLVQTNDDYVAKIGEDKYPTLKDAFDAVEDNTETTVDILKDIITARSYELNNKDIILNFGSHKIYDYCENGVINNNSKLVMDSGNIHSYGNNSITNNGILTVNQMNISKAQDGNVFFNDVNGVINIETGSYSSRTISDSLNNNKMIFENKGTLNIANGSFDSVFIIKNYNELNVSGGNYRGYQFIDNISGTAIISDITSTTNYIGNISGNLTLNNCSFTNIGKYYKTDPTTYSGMITNAVVTINGGSYTKTNLSSYANKFFDVKNSTLTIEGATFDNHLGCFEEANSTINVKSGTFGSSNSSIFNINNGSTINIDDGSFTANRGSIIENNVDGNNININITSGTLSGKYGINAYKANIVVGTKGDGEVSISNPDITGTTAGIITTSTDSTFKFYDGIIKGASAIETGVNEIEDDYEVVTSSVDGLEAKYLAKEYVIKNVNTDVDYTNIQEAITKASNGDKLRLLRNYTNLATSDTLVVPENKTLTIDIHGYTINQSNQILFENNGNLTLTDEYYDYTFEKSGVGYTGLRINMPTNLSGFIKNVSGNNIIKNNGTLILNKIQIIDSSQIAANIINNGQLDVSDSILSTDYLINNTGTATFTQSNIYNNYQNSTSISNLKGSYINNNGNMSFENCNIAGGIDSNGNGKLTLDDTRIYKYKINAKEDETYLIKFTSNLDILNSSYLTYMDLELNNSASILNIDNSTLSYSNITINSNVADEINITNSIITGYDTTGILSINSSLSTLNIEDSNVYKTIISNINTADIKSGTYDTMDITGGNTINVGENGGTYKTININPSSTSTVINILDGTYTTVKSTKAKVNIGIKGDLNDDETLKVSKASPSIGYFSNLSDYGEVNFYDGIIINPYSRTSSSMYSDTLLNELETGYYLILDDSGLYLDKKELIQNETTGEKYYTFASAINAATTGDVLKVLRNYYGLKNGDSFSISSSKDLTLDLNGYYFIGNNETLIYNYGTLHITSSSNNSAIYSTRFHATAFNNYWSKDSDIYNDGTLYIDGNFKEIDNVHNSKNKSLIVNAEYIEKITNYGNLVINSGHVYNIENYSNGKMTLNDYTLSKNAKITNDNIVNLNNCTYSGNLTITNNKTLSINGGSYSNLNLTNNNSNATTTIDNATINGNLIQSTGKMNLQGSNDITSAAATVQATGGTVNITGGIYKSTGGVAIMNSGATINIGEKGNDVSISNPAITGKTYGVNNTSGTVNFYDGVISGYTSSILGTISQLEPNYKINNYETTEDDVTKYSSVLVLDADEEKVAVVNGVNYETLQLAFNACAGTTCNVVIYTNIIPDSNIVVPEDTTINLYLNDFTVDTSTYSFVENGTLNIIETGLPEGVGASIVNTIKDVLNVDETSKNIIIYEMEDGSNLTAEHTYKLYKKQDTEYDVLTMQKEEEIGRYTIGNSDDELRTVMGRLYINNLNKGEYKLVDDEGKELSFSIDENEKLHGKVIENLNTGKGKVTSDAIAELIITIQTGITRPRYIIVTILAVAIISLLFMIKRKETY